MKYLSDTSRGPHGEFQSLDTPVLREYESRFFHESRHEPYGPVAAREHGRTNNDYSKNGVKLSIAFNNVTQKNTQSGNTEHIYSKD